MRFMMIVKADRQYEACVPPTPALLVAVGKHAEKLTRAGVLLTAEGLVPTVKGARVHVENGEIRVTDGPFTESKEIIGGWAIVRAASKDEAIEIGKEFMKIHADVLGPSYVGQLEIRQLVDARGQ
jgi:hypothetical protein